MFEGCRHQPAPPPESGSPSRGGLIGTERGPGSAIAPLRGGRATAPVRAWTLVEVRASAAGTPPLVAPVSAGFAIAADAFAGLADAAPDCEAVAADRIVGKCAVARALRCMTTAFTGFVSLRAESVEPSASASAWAPPDGCGFVESPQPAVLLRQAPARTKEYWSDFFMRILPNRFGGDALPLAGRGECERGPRRRPESQCIARSCAFPSQMACGASSGRSCASRWLRPRGWTPSDRRKFPRSAIGKCSSAPCDFIATFGRIPPTRSPMGDLLNLITRRHLGREKNFRPKSVVSCARPTNMVAWSAPCVDRNLDASRSPDLCEAFVWKQSESTVVRWLQSFSC